jgi:hypothetical protein
VGAALRRRVQREVRRVCWLVAHVALLFVFGGEHPVEQLRVPAMCHVTPPSSIATGMRQAHTHDVTRAKHDSSAAIAAASGCTARATYLASSSERFSLREGVMSPVSTERSMGRMENFCMLRGAGVR